MVQLGLNQYTKALMMNTHFILGVVFCAVLAVLSQGISWQLGGPYMVYALAIGMVVRPYIYTDIYKNGIDYTGKKILRIGVALLGARITFGEITDLGGGVVLALVGSVIATIIFGALVGRALGVGTRMGVLTGGSTAICGASAAMAISSVMPQDKKLEQQTLFTVVGVNALSTVAMVLYPIICVWLGWDAMQSGVFLGGSIHDVAQVVGAGLVMSEDVVNIATVTKLLRVATLLPIVFALSLIVYWLHKNNKIGDGGEMNAPFPMFLLGFLALVGLNSFGLMDFTLPVLQMSLTATLGITSKFILTMAIVALGMKTSPRALASVGKTSVLLLVLEMIFIALVVMGLVLYFV